MKKIISILLSFAMLIGLTAGIDLSAYADEPDSSGIYSENITYTFDRDTGLLTLEGTGDMINYNSQNAPFFDSHEIKSIVIGQGITSIGDNAFNFINLQSVSIPDSVTVIGESAFSGTGLTEVTIPNSVTTIKDYAFFGTEITKIVVPESVTELGKSTFNGCQSLKSVEILGEISAIGDRTFEACHELTSIKLPDSIKKIGKAAFEQCLNLEYITLPNSLESVGDYAFQYCQSLKELIFPKNTVSIGSYEFYYNTSLERVYILNPDCFISRTNYFSSNVTFYGYTGSTAQEFAVKEHIKFIPLDKFVNVTVAASDLGVSAANGQNVLTEDITVSAVQYSDVTLTATPAVGAAFVGWEVNGKIIYTDATITVKALADVTYTPVFKLAGSAFTVIFTDRYGNVIKTQEVESGADIEIPATVPAIAGYTFTGWSIADIAGLTESATINAVYEKNQDAKFTVTADGCTITTPNGTSEGTAADIAFDTLVTVTAEGAKAWKMNDAVVAYGETYSFYVGADVTVVPVFDDTVTPVPTIASVSQTVLDVDGFIKVSFLATRSIPSDSGCTFVNAGFVYGKDLADDNITLDDVDNTTVKAYYCATNAEQFALTYGLAAQSGKMTVRPFLAYVDADGATQVIYAEVGPLTTYTYA